MSRKTKLITTKELAARFNITRQAVYRWRKRGMPVEIQPGIAKSCYYDLQKVIDWMNKNTRK